MTLNLTKENGMKYEITYHMHPANDIVITIFATDEEEAIVYAKQYKDESFSIKTIEE